MRAARDRVSVGVREDEARHLLRVLEKHEPIKADEPLHAALVDRLRKATMACAMHRNADRIQQDIL